ncbi:hypothetical protein [Clostridium sp. D53t1_180928_C8]|uniref:hypothetical protein n=1 Tax=Clostridium sp. D53t1_180928_C8 TaxID=2787101 RepID=UPI0018A919CE|nr:hypothetical protein [Clostridium sp. D53t1_180928_C8]
MIKKRFIIKVDDNNRKLPIEGEPNSIIDLVEDNKVKQRRIFDENGKVIKDIDTSNHNRPKFHPMGAHKHVYNFNNYKHPHGKGEDLTAEEIAQNKDIIFEGINHYYNSMDS